MFLRRLTAVLHLILWLEKVQANTSTPCRTAGNWSCTDPKPYLLVGLRNLILQTALDGTNPERLIAVVGNDILMDFHYREGRVYWVDTHTGVLSRVRVDGTHSQELLSVEKGISGLAVDWRGNSVYWSSRITGTIRRTDTDGREVKTVLRDLRRPSDIALDPNARFMFWLRDGGMTSAIQRSGLTGDRVTTLLEISGRLLCLEVDVVEKKMFWIQDDASELNSLRSCDYNGDLVNVINQRLRTKSPKMSHFSDYVYMTDSESPSVMRVNKHTGEPSEELKMPSVPVDVKVIHPINQPVVERRAAFTPVCKTDECVKVCFSSGGDCKCKSGFTLSKDGDSCEDINECALWSHGCSLGCENVPGSYFCTCPEGYVLLPDHKTCREMKPCVENGTLCEHACTHTLEGDVCVCPVGSSLKPDRRACTGCVSVDRGGCSQVCVTLSPGRWECECQPGYQLQPDGKQCKAPGPPAWMLFANIVDVRRVNVDGSESRSLINESKRSIIAVDYDPVQNRVYFADTERRQIESVSVDGGETEVLIADLVVPEGITVDWINRNIYWTDRGVSSVSRSRLDGLENTVLIHDKLLRPRGVTVHPQAQMIFWTDVGVPVAVWRAGLDGSDRTVLIGSGLVSPCGITVDHSTHTLYWSDITTGHIESAGLDGSHRHTLTHEHVGRPFDVAVFEDTLWFTNWEDDQIYRLDKRTGSDAERIGVDSVHPASLVIVHHLIKPGSRDQLKNKSLNDESFPSFSEREAISEKMVSDQDECFNMNCDVNAQCVLEDGGSVCRCLGGFTGDGHLCMDINECVTGLAECVSPQSECVNTPGGYFCRCGAGFNTEGHHCVVESSSAPLRPSSGMPLDVTTPWQRGDAVAICPSTHDSFCLNHAVCLYFPEMETYACNCVAGYMGERCQFTDLEWWDLQQAEQEKRRNTAIAVCITLLLTLLCITATITYCYRCRRFSGAPVDVVSEASVCEESVTGTPSQFYVVLDHRLCKNEKMPSVVESQRRGGVCPCCSSEIDESVVSEDSVTQKTLVDLADCDTPASCTKPSVDMISLDSSHTHHH